MLFILFYFNQVPLISQPYIVQRPIDRSKECSNNIINLNSMNIRRNGNLSIQDVVNTSNANSHTTNNCNPNQINTFAVVR